MIVYNAFIGNVEVEVLHSTYPSNFMPDRRRYILPMALRLAIGGSGWNLRIHADE
jgi:hypothetical protein